jgi:hypothetical protein
VFIKIVTDVILITGTTSINYRHLIKSSQLLLKKINVFFGSSEKSIVLEPESLLSLGTNTYRPFRG